MLQISCFLLVFSDVANMHFGLGSTHTEIMHPMVPPCRNLCESVYNECIQTIRMLNVSWPGMLNCSGLPDHDEGICIAPNAFVSVTATPAPYKLKDECAFLSLVFYSVFYNFFSFYFK